jgi:hypothetical protein
MFGSGNRDNENIINGVVLDLQHAFGYSNNPIDKNAIFVSDGKFVSLNNLDSIVYPSGRHLVSYDIVNKKMDFIKLSDNKASEVTALMGGLSKKKELIIALAQKIKGGNEYPQVMCYIPSRGKWLNLPHDHLPYLDENTEINQIIIPAFKQVSFHL